ncbi:J domain-containing protein [Natronoglomus mannanivorans]|uniref:J domain-containing protein n=1 Tax=Natronoglomus mannanivorans TaxID=2979990 RepID=A0AAP3E079_9EURY|nr:J domain-containing protein [Halobacteria archaeon AArc-xg1-1]
MQYTMERHYDVLGVAPDADRSEIRRAYRALLKEHHPDQGGSRERFLRIKEAYEEITGEVAPVGDTEYGATARSEVVAADPTFDPDARDAQARARTGSGPEASPRTTAPNPNRGPRLRVDGDLLTVTLLGLVHELELASIVSGVPAEMVRTAVFFEVHNTSDRPLEWRGRAKTSFIGDDGFMYEGSNVVVPHAHEVPSWWCVTDVEIQPGRALDGFVVAQSIPEDVTVEKVVYTQHAYDESGSTVEDTERYLFDVQPRVRDALDYVPFDLEERSESEDSSNQ